jgi:hypothetical protein
VTSNPLLPSPALLAKLGSLVYHLEEYLDTGHEFDREAARSVRESADVEEWFGQMRDLAMLPVKREHT